MVLFSSLFAFISFSLSEKKTNIYDLPIWNTKDQA